MLVVGRCQDIAQIEFMLYLWFATKCPLKTGEK